MHCLHLHQRLYHLWSLERYVVSFQRQSEDVHAAYYLALLQDDECCPAIPKTPAGVRAAEPQTKRFVKIETKLTHAIEIYARKKEYLMLLLPLLAFLQPVLPLGVRR